MTVTSGHVTALRAALGGDTAAFEYMERHAGLRHGPEFPALMAAAFAAAVRSHFAGEWSPAEVIRFVSQVRVWNGDNYGGLNPGLAEQLILCALRGTPVHGQYDDVAKAYTQFMLLRDIADGLDDEQLEMLVAEAQDDADQWIAETAGR
jgi:hypothetical protein